MFRNIINGRWQLLSIEYYFPDLGWAARQRIRKGIWEFDGIGGFTQYFKGELSHKGSYHFDPKTRELHLADRTYRVDLVRGATYLISGHNIRIKARHLSSFFYL
jgi:hypothetical protein